VLAEPTGGVGGASRGLGLACSTPPHRVVYRTGSAPGRRGAGCSHLSARAPGAYEYEQCRMCCGGLGPLGARTGAREHLIALGCKLLSGPAVRFGGDAQSVVRTGV
jgi:hypothetical protein